MTMRALHACAAVFLLGVLATPSPGVGKDDEYLRSLFKLKDDDVQGHLELGLRCKRQGLALKARARFNYVVALDADHAAARKELGFVRCGQNWITPSKGLFRKLASYHKTLSELSADDASGHFDLGMWCRRYKSDILAQVSFQKVLSIDPDHGPAKVQLGVVGTSLAHALAASYVAGDEPTRTRVARALRLCDPTVTQKPKKWIALVKKLLKKLPRHNRKPLCMVQHGELQMKYRLLGRPKGRNLSLLVMLHGGGGPSVNDGAWQSAANVAQGIRTGFDLIAIPRVWWDVCAAWGTRGGTRLVMEMIRQILRSYPVDPDRVCLYGYSMGGYGVSCMGCSEADSFAALGVNAAGSDYNGAGANIMHTPITIHIGSDDTKTNRIGKARKFKTLLEHLRKRFPDSYRLEFREHAATGHALPMSAREETFEWMRQFKRNSLPSRVLWRGFANAAGKAQQKRLFYWLGMEKTQKGMYLEAHIKEGNLIDVKTVGVSAFTVFLNDKLVDLAKPVKVIVNGRERFNGKVPNSFSAVVQSYAEKEDPDMIFTARIDITKP